MPEKRVRNVRRTGPLLKKHAAIVLRRLKKRYPEADCALGHRNPYELLVATILSAQCTDKRVNMVTPAFFARYPDARALTAARLSDVEEIIHSTGFYRNKAKNLVGMARCLMEKYAGRVPETMGELLTLPGVARKTANVVLGTAFGKNEGVVVDTHIGRLSVRLGFSRHENPAKIETDLMPLFPKKDWGYLGHALIQHGRQICHARKPRCGECFLADVCPSRRA
jgi:endonuclease-3